MKAQKNLVLCFDGTSNEFRANTKDTNIVKLHNMLERSHDRQMTYYQPGIGTYTIAEGVSKSLYSKMKHWISKGVDLMFANTFDAHVTAGYRFLMQYYSHGDRIYIFGFSRGAYAARFLARMVTHVGLLPAGNQEMVRFAYKAYQNYVLDVEGAKDYMIEFRNAFCRDCHAEERSRLAEDGGTKVYFLGLFDTVSSVRYLERPFITKKRKIQKDQSTAEHIRHAVAVDERRVKFKPALLARAKGPAGYEEDTKEVWFPGNHGDVGGGWPAQQKKTPWYKRLFNWGAGTGGGVSTDKSKDAFQLSDIALQWMIDELDNLPNANGIEWNETKQKYLDRFKDHHNEALKSRMHDVMALNGGSSPLAVIMWNILDHIPWLFKYWKLTKDGWKYTRSFIPNRGKARQIPQEALFHASVPRRLALVSEYRPSNEVWITSDRHITLGDVPADEGRIKTPSLPPMRFVYDRKNTSSETYNKIYTIHVEGLN